MFRMNGKNRKKASKEKNLASKTKYQEDFNEIILNDLVPEEKRHDFGLESKEQSKPKSKKSSGIKLNLGLGGKKSSSKSKPKKDSKNSQQENKQNKGNSHEDIKNNNKEKNKKHSSEKQATEKVSNKKNNKNTKTNKTNKSKKASQSNIEEIKENSIVEENSKVIKSNKNSSLGSKKKRVRHSNKENNSETKRNIEEDSETNYITEDNFNAVTFRNTEDAEEIQIRKAQEIKEEIEVEEKAKKKFENLIWSEDKFPKN